MIVDAVHRDSRLLEHFTNDGVLLRFVEGSGNTQVLLATELPR